MNSKVFVETEPLAVVFWASRGDGRGGFGEMTVWKQRFERWNFSFVNGLYWNLRYIIYSWKLGFWEIGANFFVFFRKYDSPRLFPYSLLPRIQ
jgi:hypothetical protein